MYIVLAILVFGLLIFIHELGHYISARIFHVRIYEFAIGMGPKLVWFRSKKTGIVYALRMIPFGGFVSMEGELSEEDAGDAPNPTEDGEPAPEIVDPRLGSLASKPAWQRLIVHAAGALQNLLLGFLICVILTCSSVVGGTTVSAFQDTDPSLPSSAAQGLMVGDEILKVGSHRVHISDQLYYQIVHQGGGEEALTLTVRRNGEILTLNIHFPSEEENGISFGTLDFYVAPEEKTVGVVIKQSFYKSCYLVQAVWDSLIDLITGRYSLKAVSGPVGTAQAISEVAKTGIYSFLYIVGLISVNLGIFNLLPLPALDGGHVLYTLIELVSRKKLPAKTIAWIDTVGLFLLLALMVVVTIKDIYSCIM